jgi:hypothetical protein
LQIEFGLSIYCIVSNNFYIIKSQKILFGQDRDSNFLQIGNNFEHELRAKLSSKAKNKVGFGCPKSKPRHDNGKCDLGVPSQSLATTSLRYP